MPTSRCNHIPTVVGIVQQLAPRSILDVGVGFGKWGHLFREYTDIVAAETDPCRYARANWQVQIDGIEGHRPYLTPMHEFLYDRLYVGDMRDAIHDVGTYDVIFLGDVIEHVEKDEGRSFLQACLAHARQAVLVTTPARDTAQGAACANELEVHRSLWTPADFRALGRCVYTLDDSDTLIAVLLKTGVAAPACAPRVRRPARSPVGWWPRLRRRLSSALRLVRGATGPPAGPTNGRQEVRERIHGASDMTAPRSRPAADLTLKDATQLGPELELGPRPRGTTLEEPPLAPGARR